MPKAPKGQSQSQPGPSVNGHGPDLNGHVPNRFAFDDPIAKNMLAEALDRLTHNLTTGPTSLSRGRSVGLDDPRRSIEDECGYPPLDSTVSVDLYRQLFDRNPIANRVVQLMPREAWQKSPAVYEDESVEDETAFEQAWDDLGRQLGIGQSWHSGEEGSKVWDYLQRGNIRSRIGGFGLVVALIQDGKNLQDPVDGLVTVNWDTEPVKAPVTNRWTGQVEWRVVGHRRTNPVRTPVMPDHPMTLNELRNLTNPPTRRVWQRYDQATKSHVYKEVPGIPLTKKQRKIVANWSRLSGRFNPDSIVPSKEEGMELNAKIQRQKKQVPFSPPNQGTKPPPPGQQRGGAGAGKGPTEPNSTFKAPDTANPTLVPPNAMPEPYQTGKFNPFDPHPNPQFQPKGDDAKATGENPGAPQALFRTQSGGTKGGTNIAIPGAYGTDREYGTSDGAMSAGYGMAAPSGYGQLSGTDQQYYGVQIGPSELPSDTPNAYQGGRDGSALESDGDGDGSNEGGGDPTEPDSDQEQETDDNGQTQQSGKPALKLTGLRIYDESQVQVVRYEWNINNPRFGYPVMYRVVLNDPRLNRGGIGLPLATVFVHWSRVLHLSDTFTNASTSEIFAPPVMEPVLENILDIRKVPGAAAEGYWQSGIPTWVFQSHPQLGGDVLFNAAQAQNDMEMIQNSLQKWIAALGGMWDLKAPVVQDPTPFVEIFITLICIQLACPVRVFKGSERGELASSQDDSKWNDVVRGYQSGYITPRVICPFIDWMIMLGVLPVPSQYLVEWPDLDAMTDAEKATVFQTRAAAYAQCESGGVYNTIDKKTVMTKLDQFTEEEADAIDEEAQRQAEEDMAAAQQQAEEQGWDMQPPEGFVDPEQQDREHEQAMEVAKNPPEGGAAPPPFGGKGPPGASTGGAAGPPKPGGMGGGGPAKPKAPVRPVQPKAPPGAAGKAVQTESLVPKGKKPPTRNSFWRRLVSWMVDNSNPEGINQYSGRIAAAIAHVSRYGREDSDISQDHQRADELVAEGEQHDKKTLYQHLTKGGIEGIRPGDSKAGMLQRLHNRVTATARARDRTEV